MAFKTVNVKFSNTEFESHVVGFIKGNMIIFWKLIGRIKHNRFSGRFQNGW